MAPKKLTREWVSEVLALRAKGWSVASIARHFGVPVRRVWMALERASRQWDIDVDSLLRVERRVTIEQIDQLIESLSNQAEGASDPRYVKLMMEAIKMKSDLLGLERDEGVQRQNMRIWQELAKQISLFKRADRVPLEVVESSLPALPERETSAGDYDPAGFARDIEVSLAFGSDSTHGGFDTDGDVVEGVYDMDGDEEYGNDDEAVEWEG
jgi:hypothetical protein